MAKKSARNISDVDPGMEKENREAAERIYDNGGLLLSSHWLVNVHSDADKEKKVLLLLLEENELWEDGKQIKIPLWAVPRIYLVM